MVTENSDYTLDGVEELPPELDQRVSEMIAESEREWEQMRWGKPRRIVFDWREVHADIVVRAAQLMGLPWQDYIKQAALRQAMADLAAAGARPVAEPPAVPVAAEHPGAST